MTPRRRIAVATAAILVLFVLLPYLDRRPWLELALAAMAAAVVGLRLTARGSKAALRGVLARPSS